MPGRSATRRPMTRFTIKPPTNKATAAADTPLATDGRVRNSPAQKRVAAAICLDKDPHQFHGIAHIRYAAPCHSSGLTSMGTSRSRRTCRGRAVTPIALPSTGRFLPNDSCAATNSFAHYAAAQLISPPSTTAAMISASFLALPAP